MLAIYLTQPAIPTTGLVEKNTQDKRSALYITLSTSIALILCVSDFTWRGQIRPSPWSWWVASGAFLVAIGLAIRVWAIRTLGRFFTATVTVQDGQTVVTAGPYRLVRHPSYSGVLLVAVGASLLFQSWLTLLFAAVVVVPTYLYRIRLEEAALRVGLGAPYDEFCRTRARLIPWLL